MLRIGCLGAARITPLAIVAPVSSRNDAALAAVAARDHKRALQFAQEHGFERAEASYQSLIEAPDIDLIYNALPVSGHAEWSIRALRAGKHVLCEKPLAMNMAEAERMAEAARQSGCRLIEAFHYRYHPLYVRMLSWIAVGRIGRVMRLEAHFNAPIGSRDGIEIRHLPEAGGGSFMDLGCYPLSWCLSVIDGEPLSVKADATLTSSGVDEGLNARLMFPDGVEAVLASSMATDNVRDAQLTITGETGTIHFDNPNAPQIGSSLVLDVGGAIETAPDDRSTTYSHQLSAVIRATCTGEALPTEGERMLRQQSVLDAIYVAAGLGALRLQRR
jgi:predicted dehydrogenase